MTTFEDKLRASSRRLMAQDNKRLHVPQNPLSQKKNYWGWVATPAAAVVGVVFGMSVHLFMSGDPDSSLTQSTDTICILQPVHDTLYLTQVVEKEKIIYKQAEEKKGKDTAPLQEEANSPTCTSIQCDGINYSILATN